MAGKACLWYWLSITRLILIYSEDSVYDKLPPECLDGTKGRLEGIEPYLPISLLNDERKYLCQRTWGNKGSTGSTLKVVEKDKVMYLTLYDFTHRIPIYSAYVAEPWEKISKKDELWDDRDRTQKITVGKKTKNNDRSASWQDPKEKQKNKYEFAKSEDYTGWDTIDRGHLFPVQFTKDWLENKSTMKITNTVPQDKTFNEQQWRNAETLLKDIAIFHCQAEVEGKAFIITGSVPDYYGAEKGIPIVQEPFRIGCEDDTSVKVCPRDKMRVTVPTHMWTTLRCRTKVTTTNTKGKTVPVTTTNVKGKTVFVYETIFQSSFIGANFKHKDAKVVWYEKFSTFEKDLKRMLRMKDTDSLFTEKPKDEVTSTVVYKEMLEDSAFESTGSQLFHKGDSRFPKWHSGPTCDLYNIRKVNIENRLKKEFQHTGVAIIRFLTASLTSLNVKRLKPKGMTPDPPVKKTKLRKKREINSPKDKSKYIILELEDNDPDADIEVSKILIKETYQNGEETQTLDLTGKQIIADRNNKNENKFTASLNIDGEETELAEVASTEKFIRIELKPRSEL